MERARSRPSSVSRSGASAVVVAGSATVGAAVFFGGASADGSVPWVGGAALLTAAGVLVAACFGRLPLPALDRAALVAVAALTGLVLWTGLSIAWSIAGDLSWSALNKGIAYLAFLAVGLAFGL